METQAQRKQAGIVLTRFQIPYMLEKVFSNLLPFDDMEVNWKYTNYYSCLYWNPPSYVFKLSIHISLIWHSVSIIVLSLVQYVLYSVINLSTFCTYCTAKLY